MNTTFKMVIWTEEGPFDHAQAGKGHIVYGVKSGQWFISEFGDLRPVSIGLQFSAKPATKPKAPDAKAGSGTNPGTSADAGKTDGTSGKQEPPKATQPAPAKTDSADSGSSSSTPAPAPKPEAAKKAPKGGKK